MNSPSDLPNEPDLDPAVEQNARDAFQRLNTDASNVDAMDALRRHENRANLSRRLLRPAPILATFAVVLTLGLGLSFASIFAFGQNDSTSVTIDAPEPTAVPPATPVVTATPAPSATLSPTLTPAPTVTPDPELTPPPTVNPDATAAANPTAEPTTEPTTEPTAEPTAAATTAPATATPTPNVPAPTPVTPPPTATAVAPDFWVDGAGRFEGTWQMTMEYDAILVSGGPVLTLTDSTVVLTTDECGSFTGLIESETDGLSGLRVKPGSGQVTDNDCGTSGPSAAYYARILRDAYRAEIEPNDTLYWVTDENPGGEIGLRFQRTLDRVFPPTEPTPTATPVPAAGQMTLGAGPFAGSWQRIRSHDAFDTLGNGPTLFLGADGTISGTAGCNTFMGQVQSDGVGRLAVVVGSGTVTTNDCGNEPTTRAAADFATSIAQGFRASIRSGNLIWVFGSDAAIGDAEHEFVRIG